MSRTPTMAEVIADAMLAARSEIRVALPARVESYDAAKQTVDVKPMVRNVMIDEDGETLNESLPVIPGVPVCFPRGGGFVVAMPLAKGDFVQLLFNDRSIDQWYAKGRESDPADLRMHDISDAVAIPGVYPGTAPLADASAQDLVIGKDGGDALLTLKADGSILIGRAAALEAARKGDAVQATIPAGTVVVAASGAVMNAAPITLTGQITGGSAKVKIG